ncbi:MarR family winged helix-turn-helix transcriptional regulator [Sinomonas atrocyanea]|uniref:MarR family winged helix-turn-helix transcriptional regulator n=1 Tax=Sinomonas atrocyanea TaxID=37927 RepID=UPI003D971E0E
MAENIANLLGAVFEAFRAELYARDRSGLRSSQLRYLTLVPDDGVRVGDMAALASMSKAGAGQFAAALEEQGFVEILADPADSRAKIVRRTAAGRRIASNALAAVAEIEEAWGAAIGPERYRAMRAALEEIAGLSHAPSPAEPNAAAPAPQTPGV